LLIDSTNWRWAEFLNDIKCSRITNHRIKLKVGVTIMPLIDQANDLCNGTRLQVNDLEKNVIFAIGNNNQKCW